MQAGLAPTRFRFGNPEAAIARSFSRATALEERIGMRTVEKGVDGFSADRKLIFPPRGIALRADATTCL